MGEYQKALRYLQVHRVLPDTHADKQPFASEYVALRTPIQLNTALCASKVAQAWLKARVSSLAQAAQGQTTSVTRASKSTTGMPLSVPRIASVVPLTFARLCTRKQRPDQVIGGRHTLHWASDLLALRSGGYIMLLRSLTTTVLLTTSTSVSDCIASWGEDISPPAESFTLRTAGRVEVCTVLPGTPIPPRGLLPAQTTEKSPTSWPTSRTSTISSFVSPICSASFVSPICSASFLNPSPSSPWMYVYTVLTGTPIPP